MPSCARRLLLLIVLLPGLPTAASAQFGLLTREGARDVPLRRHHATVEWEDGVATTTLRQVFLHEGAAPLEAVYLFPLPEGARLTALAMETGGTRLEGFLAERRQARRTYDRLVRRDVDPALVEQVGRSSFRLSVFPVVPHQPTTVELSWVEEVPLLNGEATLVHAMARSRPPTEAVDVAYSLTARSSATLVALHSEDPDLAVSTVSDFEQRASLERKQEDWSQDLVVRLRVTSPEARLKVHVYRPPGQAAHFAAILTPPVLSSDRVLPRDITLALDVSGSMKGEKLAQAVQAGRALVEQVGPEDSVNLILFNDSVRSFAEQPLPLDDFDRTGLLAFLDGAVAQGGTDLEGALRALCSGKARPGRVAIAAILTDGIPSTGEKRPEELVQRAREGAQRGLRVFPFGVGPDVEGSLLEAVAEAGGGTAEIFRPGGEIAARLQRFLLRTAAPAIAELQLRIDGRAVRELSPQPLPAVYLGEQTVITGRWPGEGRAPLELRGLLGGRDFVLRSEVDFGSQDADTAYGHPLARTLGALERLDFYERAVRLREGLSDAAFFAALDRAAGSTADELVDAALAVSLASGLQCAYTSFLALLPEDRARLQATETAALDEALQQALERRQEWEEAARREHAPPKETEVNTLPIDAQHEFVSAPGFDVPPLDTSGRQPLDSPFDGRNLNDVISAGRGVGGGFGGKYGRRGGRAGKRSTQAAVEAGEGWFARHQGPDFLWHEGPAPDDPSLPAPSSSIRASALVLLGYLGAGNTSETGPHRATVRRVVLALRNEQREDGALCSLSDPVSLGAHALGTLALVEAYALSGVPILRRPAQRAVLALLACQQADGSFAVAGAGADPVKSREIPTAHALLALAAAKDATLLEDPATAERGLDFLLSRVGPERTERDPCTCAAALLLQILLERVKSSDEMAELRDHVSRVLHESAAQGPLDPVLRHYGSYALWQCGRAHWESWEPVLLDQVVRTQIGGEGEDRGSWDPPAGVEEGRVAYTAWSVLAAEVYYRYDHLLMNR